jgi:hypothetical protein
MITYKDGKQYLKMLKPSNSYYRWFVLNFKKYINLNSTVSKYSVHSFHLSWLSIPYNFGLCDIGDCDTYIKYAYTKEHS